MDRRFFGIMLLLFLSASEEKMKHIEAKICQSPSKEFKGLCFQDQNCASICEREGFLFGRCKGFRRRCICIKDCSGSGESPPPQTPEPPESPPQTPTPPECPPETPGPPIPPESPPKTPIPPECPPKTPTPPQCPPKNSSPPECPPKTPRPPDCPPKSSSTP